MPEREIDPSTLLVHEFSAGVSIGPLLSTCEAVVVHYEAGAVVPLHEHTQPVLSIVLRGRIRGPGGMLGPGKLIECTGAYGPRVAEEEVFLLIVQPVGTRYVPINEPS